MTEKQRQDAMAAVRTLLASLGEDTTREGLDQTPRRVVKFYEEFYESNKDFAFTTFEKEKYNQMVIVKDIPFFSLCEHHMAPFFGVAHIAYLPNKKGKICGISKLPRTLYKFANRLQNQERITTQVAEFLMEQLQPLGCAVVIEARHLCMEMRGAKTHNAVTITSERRGVYESEQGPLQEFLNFIKK